MVDAVGELETGLGRWELGEPGAPLTRNSELAPPVGAFLVPLRRAATDATEEAQSNESAKANFLGRYRASTSRQENAHGQIYRI